MSKFAHVFFDVFDLGANCLDPVLDAFRRRYVFVSEMNAVRGRVLMGPSVVPVSVRALLALAG